MQSAITRTMHEERGSHINVGALFAATLFTGAFLIFWIQPLFGKMILPLLGGTPNVWVTAMLFFQAMLLAGYGYAHLLIRIEKVRIQIALHLAVLGAGFASLPIAVAQTEEFREWPVLWLIILAAVSIGLPFFAASATAPLLQRWFACGRHDHADDPYFLYAASNLGSIVALLAYPTLGEPLLRISEQSWGWTAGYGVLVVMILACGVSIGGSSVSRSPAISGSVDSPADMVTWRQRAIWIGLAFAPSSLLLGVTTHITTDVASAPLLWVIPLILYLLTFVIAFSRRPILKHRWMVLVQPFVVLPALFFMVRQGQWVTFLADIAVFFVLSLVCHGELVRRRPSAAHLTDFYFSISIGGMLGGCFNAVIAPIAFDRVYEFPIALTIACLLRPGPYQGSKRERIFDLALPALLLAGMMAPAFILRISLLEFLEVNLFWMMMVAGTVVFAFKDRPLRFGLGIGALLVIATLALNHNVIDRQRSFFGVYSIVDHEDGITYVLKHGTTVHGAQKKDPSGWREPLTYFTREGPVGQVFSALERSGKAKRVGLVGLGVGSVVCYSRPGQRWVIYEIDPLIERIARDTRYFHYMAECYDPSAMEISLGDARLTLAKQKDRTFDLLIIDAFSSDSVPLHLLTREAMSLYRERLNKGGIILMHISNRLLDLRTVVGRLISDAGMHGLVQIHSRKGLGATALASEWVVIGRNKEDLDFLSGNSRWKPMEAAPSAPVWTDDFSNIISIFRWDLPLRHLHPFWRG